MIYTSEQLSQILLDTRIKSIDHEVILQPELDRAFAEKVESDDAPPLAKVMYSIGGSNALMNCLNYWNIRDQVHDYQREYDVSGIVEEVRIIRGKEFRYRNWNEQLLLLDRDLPVLQAEVPKVVEFFLDMTTDYDLYLDESEDDTEHIPIDEAAIRRHAVNAAYCWIHSDSHCWEKVSDEQWQSCAFPGEPPIDDDEIGINLYLDRPDSDESEVIRILARHRDETRFPWLKDQES